MPPSFAYFCLMHISTTTWKWLLIGAGLALLLMMLAYPFGYDQAAFMVGGEMTVKHGAIPYRDFLDTKPPIIFLIYGFSSIIFGHHEWSIRAFDVLFHIVTLFYFFKILKRTLADENLALFTVFLYALIYSAGGYWMTAQAESFALLPSLIVFDCTERALNNKRLLALGIYAGLASAILFLLKFTFLTVPIGACLYILFQSKNVKRIPWKYLLGMIIGFTILTGGYLEYLIATHTFTRFIESLEWLKGYAAIDPLFSSHTIGELYFKQFPLRLVGAFSLSGIVLAAIGMMKFFQDRSKRSDTSDTNEHSPLLHLFFQLMLGLIAVLYERKFFPYHFSRTYWAFVPFIAVCLSGMKTMLSNYSVRWRMISVSSRLLRCLAVFLLCATLVFYSTAARIISQPAHWMYMRLSGGDVAADVQSKMEQYYYKEEQQLANHLRPVMKADDKIFVWGNSIGIYYFLEKYPTTIVLTNTPLITEWTPQSWKDTLIHQLNTNPPRFFIAESGDDREYITGTKLDSWQNLNQWDSLRDFVKVQYDLKDSLGHFRIFEHKSF